MKYKKMNYILGSSLEVVPDLNNNVDFVEHVTNSLLMVLWENDIIKTDILTGAVEQFQFNSQTKF